MSAEFCKEDVSQAILLAQQLFKNFPRDGQYFKYSEADQTQRVTAAFLRASFAILEAGSRSQQQNQRFDAMKRALDLVPPPLAAQQITPLPAATSQDGPVAASAPYRKTALKVAFIALATVGGLLLGGIPGLFIGAAVAVFLLAVAKNIFPKKGEALSASPPPLQRPVSPAPPSPKHEVPAAAADGAPVAAAAANQPREIRNMGNTCYAASLVQIIMNNRHLRLLYNTMLREEHPLRRVMQQYDGRCPVDISPLTQFFKNSGGQQDPHDLLIKFELPREFTTTHNGNIEGTELGFIRMQQNPNGTLVVDQLDRAEGEELIPARQFPQITLNFPEERNGLNLQAMIESAKQQRSGNRIIKIYYSPPPETVIFTLVRHRHGQPPIRDSVDVPEVVEGPFVDGAKYALQGFIHHDLESMDRGHYVAYVKRGERYFRCNDALVTEIKQDEFLGAAQRAYMLNYNRVRRA